MTALRAGDIEKFVSRPDPRRPIILLYGPDVGLVSERSGSILRALSEGADSDPFAIVPLDGDAIASDPGLLDDEVRTYGLFGVKRIIRIRAGGKNFASALEPLLKNPPQATIVIEAGELRANSPLRSLCEKSASAAVLPCYIDSARDIAQLIDRSFAAAQIAIDPDAREELISLLGADRLSTRSELEKLALYAKNEKRVRVEDVRAVIADASAIALDDVVDFAAAGEPRSTLAAIKKAYEAGVSGTALLGAAIRHMAVLHRLRLGIDGSGSASRVIENARPPIFFRRKPNFERALARFDSRLLEQAIIALSAANLEVRRNPKLADVMAERAILRIAYGTKLPVEKRSA